MSGKLVVLLFLVAIALILVVVSAVVPEPRRFPVLHVAVGILGIVLGVVIFDAYNS